MKVGIFGAGAVGCFVGGCLQGAGFSVVLLGRERLRSELETSGLTAVVMNGRSHACAQVQVATEPAALGACDVVLVCVKSAQTTEAAGELAPVLAPGAVVVSLQNGIHNAELLRAGLPDHEVCAGIVGFNVVPAGSGVFRQATSGPLVIERSPHVALLARGLRDAGLQVDEPAAIRPLQWSKLVMNLNNAVSALTDRPTQELLFGPGYRFVLAALMAEAVAALRASGTATARLGPLPVALFPWMLRLPTPILKLVARSQIKVDPEARSSMWEDLVRGRLTEVDFLNGEIVTLAAAAGVPAPLNARIVELVHEAEAQGRGSPRLDAPALWRALSA